MKSLKDRLMFWRSGKAVVATIPTFEFHNELLISPGAHISLQHLDFDDRKLKVAAYQEWRRQILESTFRFTDYTFEEPDENVKLRAYDDSEGKDDNVWLLRLWYEQQTTIGQEIDPETDFETYLKKISENKEPFQIKDDDNNVIASFRRFKGLQTPHLGITYPERGSYHYWDFYNEDKHDQMLFIEQNLNTRFLQVWLAERVLLAHIFADS